MGNKIMDITEEMVDRRIMTMLNSEFIDSMNWIIDNSKNDKQIAAASVIVFAAWAIRSDIEFRDNPVIYVQFMWQVSEIMEKHSKEMIEKLGGKL